MSHLLSEILNEYLEVRGGSPEDYVFCNNYGEQGDIRAYQEQVYKYNIQRNVSKTSCHLFRHTFAKRWIMAGGDIFRLQKILGHSDLTVTKEYVQMFGQDLQIDFERFNHKTITECRVGFEWSSRKTGQIRLDTYGLSSYGMIDRKMAMKVSHLNAFSLTYTPNFDIVISSDV